MILSFIFIQSDILIMPIGAPEEREVLIVPAARGMVHSDEMKLPGGFSQLIAELRMSEADQGVRSFS
jgi:hypothetical protein